jgi:hypothetical protein
MKVAFVRGNENIKDGIEEVGGSRVYGGAILSRRSKNIYKWLKVRKTSTLFFNEKVPRLLLLLFFMCDVTNVEQAISYASRQ